MKDRITELLDFATNQSPYRNANKGWLNNDIYFNWGKFKSNKTGMNNSILDITLFWDPVKAIISILFVVILISSVFIYLINSIKDIKLKIIHNTFPLELIENDSNINNKPEIENSFIFNEPVDELKNNIVAEIIEEKENVDISDLGISESSKFPQRNTNF